MMFVVIGKESEGRVLIDHVRFENLLIPINHFIKASSAVDDVREFCRSCHLLFPFGRSHEPAAPCPGPDATKDRLFSFPTEGAIRDRSCRRKSRSFYPYWAGRARKHYEPVRGCNLYLSTKRRKSRA